MTRSDLFERVAARSSQSKANAAALMVLTSAIPFIGEYQLAPTTVVYCTAQQPTYSHCSLKVV